MYKYWILQMIQDDSFFLFSLSLTLSLVLLYYKDNKFDFLLRNPQFNTKHVYTCQKIHWPFDWFSMISIDWLPNKPNPSYTLTFTHADSKKQENFFHSLTKCLWIWLIN